MAENVNNTIKTKVELDANQAQQEIVKLNSLASDGTQDLEKRLASKNKQIEIQNKLNKKAIADAEAQVKSLQGVVGAEKSLEKAVKKLEKAKLNEVKVNERNAKQQRKLQEGYDESKSAVGRLNNATGGFIDKLKALAANPIVLVITALVGVLSLLKKAFTSSEEGQNKFAKASAILNTVVGNLMDILSDLANTLVDLFMNPKKSLEDFGTLIKNNIVNRFNGLLELVPKLGKAIGLLFKGKFSEAGKVAADAVGKVTLGVESITDTINKATEAVGEFIKEQEREIEISKRISDQRANADKIERDLIVQRAKANRDRAEALENSVNKEKFSIKERIDFLKEAGQIEQDITDKEIAAAKIRLQTKIAENALSNSTKEDLEEEAQLKANIINLEQARLVKQKEVTGQIQAFKAEQKAADDKEAAEKKAKEDKAEEERLAKIQEEKEQKQRDNEEQLALDEFELERLRNLGEAKLVDELAFLEKQRTQELANKDLSAKQKALIEKKYNKQSQELKNLEKKQSKDKDMAILESSLGAIGELFGASKEISIAGALINTYKGISEVWASKSETGLVGAGLVQKIATTAIVAAQGFKTVKNIASTKAPKVKGGSGGGGGGGGAIPTASVPQIPKVSTEEVSDLSSSNQARLGQDSQLANSSTQVASANVQGSSGGNVTFSESSYSEFQDQVKFKENKSTI